MYLEGVILGLVSAEGHLGHLLHGHVLVGQAVLRGLERGDPRVAGLEVPAGGAVEAADVPAVLEVVDVEVDGGGERREQVGEVDEHAHPWREVQFALKKKI